MIHSLIIAAGGIIALMTIWAIIQFFWKKTFSEYISDDDVLADRKSCGNCGCTTSVCKNKGSEF
ncbi:MAG TPA: hypothetical protein ENJ95_09225 [Bacteroidetes bacterium]|nr:hypothetical protein [Bacteroidota bacterium]